MLKKGILILLLISTFIAAGFSQYESGSGYYEKGKVLEGLSMNSELLGDDDFLFRGNSALHVTMRERGIDHQYRIRDGSHEWTYWRTHITTGLEFIGKSFQR